MISIIIPVYNAEDYMERCINSVIDQTYQDIEIILIDDGSNDRSGKICDKYQMIDNRVKVIHKENQGVSAARNTGIDIATGDFIGFVDADDYIEKDMYEYLYKIINQNNADIAICNYDNVNDNFHSSLGSYMSKNMIMKSSEAIENVLKTNGFKGYLWNKLFRVELLKNNQKYIRLDPDISICEDLLFVCKCISRSKTIVYSPLIKYHYYNNKQSVLRSNFNRNNLSILKAYEQIEEIINEYPSARSSFVSNITVSYTNLMIQILESGHKNKIDYTRIKNVLKKNWKTIALDSTVKNKYKVYCFMIVYMPNFFIKLKKILHITKEKLLYR